MLKWAIIFALISLVAGGLGFYALAGVAAFIAKILFFIFLAVCALFILLAIFVVEEITGG